MERTYQSRGRSTSRSSMARIGRKGEQARMHGGVSSGWGTITRVFGRSRRGVSAYVSWPFATIATLIVTLVTRSPCDAHAVSASVESQSEFASQAGCELTLNL